MVFENPDAAYDRARARRGNADFIDVLDAALRGDKGVAITLARRASLGEDVEAMLRKRMA